MIKNLRFFLLSMVAMLGVTNAFAEDIIWQEDWTGAEKNAVPSDINAAYSQEGSGTKIYAESLAGGTAPELLIGKNGGSFTVSINLNGMSGDMTLSYMANYDRITVSAEGATLGEKANVGNSYSIPVTVTAGTTSITLTFKNETSSNVRFDNAKLYQGTAKKPAGLSWGTASRTVKLGDENMQLPTLSNENGLPVTFESSNTDVATVSNEGVIAVVAVGKATITASFAGNDEYEAQTVSVDITVNDGGETPQPVEADTITVAKALEVIAALENNATTAEEYLVKGYVVEVTDINTSYGNITFTIVDAIGGENVLTVFRAKGFNGAKITDENLLKAGDVVVVKGKLQKYVKDEVVTPEVTSGSIVTINGKNGGDTPQPEIQTITVAKALEIGSALEANKTTNEEYIVKGIVAADPTWSNFNDKTTGEFKNYILQFEMKDADGTSTLLVYNAWNLENTYFLTIDEDLKTGIEVELQGKIQNYVKNEVSTIELVKGHFLKIGTKTGVEAVKANKRFEGAIYNLAGQRVKVAGKGLYIMNGKKFFVK